MSRYRRISGGRWPSGDGKPVGVLGMSASEFSRRSGVRFTPGEDDLGPFMEAALVLESGRLILLMRYTAERENTLTVMSDGQDDPIEARSEFLDVFGLQPDTFEWIPNQGFVSID